jgi:hypothetical protein
MSESSEIVQTRLSRRQYSDFTKWKEERECKTDAQAARNLILQALDHAKDLQDLGDDIRQLRQELQRQHQEVSTLIDSINVLAPAVIAYHDKNLTYEQALQKWLNRRTK